MLTNRWEECSAGRHVHFDHSHVSIFLLTNVITKRKYIFDMQFPCLPVGVKCKVVKNVYCPLLLIDTGLMSIGPLTKKLLQKHRAVSYSKKQRKSALSLCSLTESSAESELSRLDAHWDGLCGLVLITSSENFEKEGCETWSALPFWRSHCLDFFEASRFGVIAVYRWMCHEYQKQNQLNPALCVPSVGILNLTQAVRMDLYAKMEMLAWICDIYI